MGSIGLSRFLVLFCLFVPGRQLIAAGQLQGKVSDSKGDFLAGATVRLEPDAHVRVTDKDGGYVFREIFPGRYAIVVSLMGYRTVSGTVLVGKDTTVYYDVQLEEALLEEVHVTGKRTNVDNILGASESAQIVKSISKETIAAMGSRRLDEVLREQTGMAVVSDLGSGNRAVGLQMQGFSSEYITILINGQPMGGRHGGNFDLSRISVNDIERIEVIKGASCSFYGSEALGGTINIITRQTITAPQAAVGITQGTYATTDANLSGETPFASGNGFVSVSGNYYRTAGFNVNPYLENGKTAPPYASFGLNSRARWQLTKNGFLNFSSRFAARNSNMERNYGALPTADRLKERDLNAMVAWDQYLAGSSRWMSRYYFTRYAGEQEIRLTGTGGLLQQSDFIEYLHRFEEQYSLSLSDQRLKISSGAGVDYQRTQSKTGGAEGDMLNYFAYTQTNFEPVSSLSIVAGLRYDGNARYGGRLNPTAGINFKPTGWLGVNVSLGSGFKTPSYRQRYQRFTNLGQGYTVLGTSGIDAALAGMKETGDLQQVWAIAARVKDLQAESSTSWNVQLHVRPHKNLLIDVNGFYNRIRNLIVSQQIGIKSNGAQLFSWFNIEGMYATGLEGNLQWRAGGGITLSAGYQLLDMRDRAVLDSIRNATGDYGFVRAESGIRKAKVSDYSGLPNRSRHSGMVQAGYFIKPWKVNISLRTQLRGKYGFLDIDNNGYIDRYDVFVRGYVLFNASVQKKLIRNRLAVQLTADNLGNYTDYLMPGQPGRMVLLSANWTFTGKKKE